MDGNKNKSIIHTTRFDVHTAYAHARIERASDQPVQHDENAIAQWERKFIPPTRRLW